MNATSAQIRLHVYQADGYLPAVCMCCGRPATATTTKKMRWHPQWVGGIAALIMTKYATVQRRFATNTRGTGSARTAAVGFALPACPDRCGRSRVRRQPRASPARSPCRLPLSSAASCSSPGSSSRLYTCTTIRPTEITDEEITLTGVCFEEFGRGRRRGGAWSAGSAGPPGGEGVEAAGVMTTTTMMMMTAMTTNRGGPDAAGIERRYSSSARVTTTRTARRAAGIRNCFTRFDVGMRSWLRFV